MPSYVLMPLDFRSLLLSRDVMKHTPQKVSRPFLKSNIPKFEYFSYTLILVNIIFSQELVDEEGVQFGYVLAKQRVLPRGLWISVITTTPVHYSAKSLTPTVH